MDNENLEKVIENIDQESLKYLMEVVESDYNFQETSVLVHPGFSEYTAWHDYYPSISEEEYVKYKEKVQKKVEERREKNAPIVTLYPKNLKELTLNFLNVDEEDLYLVETEPPSFLKTFLQGKLSPVPTSEGRKKLTAILSSINANSSVPVSGELRGGCYDLIIKILNKVCEDKHVTFEEELYFPEKPYKEYKKRGFKDWFKEKLGF